MSATGQFGLSALTNPDLQQALTQQSSPATPAPTTGPATTIPSAPVPGSPPVPGSVEDLEQRAQQNLIADVQNRAAQINPTPPGQLSPNNPFAQRIQELSTSLQATAPDPTPKRGVKGLLSNFFQGAGSAMMHEAGVPTPYEQRQQALQDFAHYNQLASVWESNQQEMAYRQALMGQLDDNRRFQSMQQPIQLQREQLENQALAYNVQQQQSMIHPSMTAGDLQSLGLSPNLSGQFAGKPLTSGDMQALMQMSSLSANKTFDYGQDGTGPNKGIWLVDRQYNPIKQLSPISETGRSTALAKMQQQLAMQGAKTGYAYDPATQQTVLTSAAEARQNLYQAFRPVTEANIRNDTHDSQVLNDIATKTNNVARTAKALDQGPGQQAIIAQALSAADKDSQFRLGAFGTTIPTGWFNGLMNQTAMQGASQQTRDYIVALLSLRESAMGMTRLLTGSARSNESQIQALQQTLPGLETDSGLALQKLQSFGQNLSMLRGGLPRLPGIQSVPLFDPSQPIAPGQSINAPLPSDFEAPSTQAPASTSSAYLGPVSYQTDANSPVVQQGARMLRAEPQKAMQRLRRMGLLKTT